MNGHSPPCIVALRSSPEKAKIRDSGTAGQRDSG
jgi:hypothetical protein